MAEPHRAWVMDKRARRHLYGNECPHIPTGGQKRSGFGCDACTQKLIEDVESAAVAAVAAERKLQEKAWSAGFRHCLEWYGIWKDGEQVIGCKGTPIRKCGPYAGQMKIDLGVIRAAAIRKAGQG